MICKLKANGIPPSSDNDSMRLDSVLRSSIDFYIESTKCRQKYKVAYGLYL